MLAPRKRRPRLGVEELENRTVPSVVLYDAIGPPDQPNPIPGKILRIDAQSGKVTKIFQGAKGTTDGPNGSTLQGTGEAPGGPIAVAPGGTVLFEGAFAGKSGLFALNPSGHARPRLLDRNGVQALVTGPHGALFGITTLPNSEQQSIVRVNPKTGAPTRVFTAGLGDVLGSLAVTPSGTFLITANINNKNGVFQLTSGSATPTLLDGNADIAAVAAGPHGEIYALPGLGSTIADHLVRIDPTSGAETRLFQTTNSRDGFAPGVLVVEPNGTVLVTGSVGKKQGLLELNPSSGTVRQVAPVFADAMAVTGR